MPYEEEKKLGKNQKHILLFAYWNELVLTTHPLLAQSCQSLIKRGLIELQNEQVILTPLGNRIVESSLLNTADLSISSLEELLAVLESQITDKIQKVRKLGKKQNIFLRYIAQNPLEVTSENFENTFILTLKENDLLEFDENQIKITDAGLSIIDDPINELDESLKSEIPSVILNSIGIKTNKITKKETMFLQFLNHESSRSLKYIRRATQLIPSLEQKGLLEVVEGKLQITSEGKGALENNQQNSKYKFNILELVELFLTPNKIEAEQQAQVKSSEILELRKQGLTLEAIGNLYGLTRERVRQILAANPDLEEYLKEEERVRVLAEKEIEERKKQEFLENSLAYKFPERIAELWDYEKNGAVKPEDVLASNGMQSIWLKCPKDDYSWEKKARDIAFYSWERVGTSGCPKCSGKTKKRETHPPLTEKYLDFVIEYWDFEKNSNFGLNPEIVSSGSNKKAWFKCPKDNNEWSASIASTVNQQWSLGNAGCRVCNGTHLRKRGVWGKAGKLIEEFPDEVAKFWDYAKNNELKLNPMEITIGSARKAWFKCPIDGCEWQSNIAPVANTSWRKGNSGCPVCRGLIANEQTSIVSLYPDFVRKYWDFDKNNDLGLLPSELTRGTNTEVWFKCPLDGFEWQSRIASIRKASWDLGNSGCARCFGWTTEAIRQFIASLEEHIPNLTQSERYKIFEQSGILGIKNSESLKIIKDIIKGKLTGQKLREVIRGKQIDKIETLSDTDVNLDLNSELKIAEIDSVIGNTQNSQNEFDFTEEIEETVDLPKVRIQKSLEFLSSNIVASSDQEAVDFFVASRRNRIWAEVFEDESAVEGMEAFADDGYGRQVRDQFLDEYIQARDMQIPIGWAFRIDGKITPPNLMQKVAAVRLKNQKRMLNLSLTGTGKTIGGILSSRIINANLTIIICPLDTINNWHSEIKNVFPDSKVTTKNFNPYWLNVEDGHHFIILNHEMFQQPTSANNIKQLLDRYKIDLIIVDEIHRCKQRSEDPSKRRQMVLALITNANELNPDLHVLGMSATPIINNLKEGKSLVELVTGIERADLAERATINNCMKLHQAFVTLGIRSRVKPKITINRTRIPIDCTHLVDEIREDGTSVLKMEQILTSARIPTILAEIRPKTIIYTHYVEGIVNQLKEAIEAKGWSVGFHIGGNKSGRERFINGSTDVLIASSAMAVGVDGFQRVCDRLILNIPPWTSAELEQLEGRLNRQGQIHDTLTIIFPITFGTDGEEYWSWDEGRLARLQNKQTIADAAVDGVMPEGQLRTEAQAFRDLRKWLDRLKDGEQKTIVRPKIFVPLPDVDESDVKRRIGQYGDFSRMNARWNTSYSSTTFQRLRNNPEEWMQYHTLYQNARQIWEIVPYEETIKWLEKRSNLVVGDFGCGEAIIAKEISEKHTIHNFDYIAINDSVIECDISKVPLLDEELDVAVFNLSLMGKNYVDYLVEAKRTLKLDGQLLIYEVESQSKNIDDLVKNLESLGFNIIENYVNWKFRFIRAIKSE
jgi:hypothetical protein